jgi:hypothetical protein
VECTENACLLCAATRTGSSRFSPPDYFPRDLGVSSLLSIYIRPIFREARYSSLRGPDFMSIAKQKASIAKPRWDGSRVLFEIEATGNRIPCAISRAALQDLSGRRHFASTDLLRCFAEARVRIEAIAASKFRVRPESVSGIVSIWADDVDDAPPAPARQQEQRCRV